MRPLILAALFLAGCADNPPAPESRLDDFTLFASLSCVEQRKIVTEVWQRQRDADAQETGEAVAWGGAALGGAGLGALLCPWCALGIAGGVGIAQLFSDDNSAEKIANDLTAYEAITAMNCAQDGEPWMVEVW